MKNRCENKKWIYNEWENHCPFQISNNFLRGDLNSSLLEGKGKIQGHTMFEKIKKKIWVILGIKILLDKYYKLTYLQSQKLF